MPVTKEEGLFWLVEYLDTCSTAVFSHEHTAHAAASQAVGNHSAAAIPRMGSLGSTGYLYGPGDGTTSVMVRGFTRDVLLGMGLSVPPAG